MASNRDPSGPPPSSGEPADDPPSGAAERRGQPPQRPRGVIRPVRPSGPTTPPRGYAAPTSTSPVLPPSVSAPPGSASGRAAVPPAAGPVRGAERRTPPGAGAGGTTVGRPAAALPPPASAQSSAQPATPAAGPPSEPASERPPRVRPHGSGPVPRPSRSAATPPGRAWPATATGRSDATPSTATPSTAAGRPAPVARPTSASPAAYARPAGRGQARPAALATGHAAAQAAALAQPAVVSAPAALPRTAAPELPAPAVAAPRIPPTPPGRLGGLRPRQRRTLPGGIHLGQIYCWQAALAAVVAAIGRPLGVLLLMVLSALGVTALTAVRVRRRWLYQWLLLRARYLVRRRRHVVTPTSHPALVLLEAVVPGARVRTVEMEGEPVGVIEHLGGVAAILEPVPVERGLIIEKPVSLPSPVSLLPLAEVGDPAVSAQVLVQVMPAPAPDDPNEAPATSYRQLLAGTVPAQRRAWIALQVQRTVDAYSDAELQQALSSAVRRMRRRLGKEGMPVRVLDQSEVLTALAALGQLDQTQVGAAPDGAAEIREGWSDWRAGGTPETCFRIAHWPDLNSPELRTRQFFDRLSTVSTLSTTYALATRRAGADLEVESVVRIAAPTPASLERAVAHLEAEARTVGARLERLDGEQYAGVAASLPLGGFLP